uniref:E3 ubiquitin-protein ligase CHIP n=1 Tax=Theileria annulata TaxID=5874 RepID=A0A3B0MG62_THEAN
MDEDDGRDLTSLDSLEEKKTDTFYNITFNDIDHAIYSANENVEFHKDRNKIRKAEDYRNLGNESFKKGFLESAIDYYTKAIKVYPHNHEFYTNRALCYKKQNKWDLVESDVRQALNLEENSVKAHYYLGQALLNLGDPVEGMKKLRKAKCLSEHYKVPYIEEIDNEILKAKKAIWESQDIQFNNTLNSFYTFISELIEREKSENRMELEEYGERIQQLELFRNYITKSKEKHIPPYLCCKISMCLMRDPVISSSGLTYERKLLETHLLCNGEYDPITREVCKMSDLVSNYHIKEAVEDFLEKNPWAFDDYYTV